MIHINKRQALKIRFLMSISSSVPLQGKVFGQGTFQCPVFCCFLVFLLQFMCFPRFLVCNPGMCSLNRFMTFEQRYTTVALIFEEVEVKST